MASATMATRLARKRWPLEDHYGRGTKGIFNGLCNLWEQDARDKQARKSRPNTIHPSPKCLDSPPPLDVFTWLVDIVFLTPELLVFPEVTEHSKWVDGMSSCTVKKCK